jgi:hypothetical protein
VKEKSLKMKIFLILILISSASAIFITCEFYYIDWPLIGNVYICDVLSMDFSGNSTHITGYDGIHWSGKSGEDIGMIAFYYPECPQFNLQAIPKRLGQKL